MFILHHNDFAEKNWNILQEISRLLAASEVYDDDQEEHPEILAYYVKIHYFEKLKNKGKEWGIYPVVPM